MQRQGGGGGARCGDRPAGPGERAAGRGEKGVGCRGLLGPRERKGGRAGKKGSEPWAGLGCALGWVWI